MTLSESDGGTCLSCGYNLTGLDDRRACPECGLLVGLSRQDKTELGRNHPRWLRRLVVGSVLLLVAIVLSIGTPVGLVSLAELRQDRVAWGVGGFDWMGDVLANGSGLDQLRLLGSLIAVVLGPFVALVGIDLLTARPPGKERRPKRAIILKTTALLVFACVTLLGLLVTGWEHLAISEWLFGFSLIGGPIALMILTATLSLWMRHLAQRAPAPLLAADSPVIGFVLSGSIAYGLVATLLAAIDIHLSDLVGRDGVFLITFFVFVLGLTAAIWSVYLLTRYALAFAKTRSQALALFRESAA